MNKTHYFVPFLFVISLLTACQQVPVPTATSGSTAPNEMNNMTSVTEPTSQLNPTVIPLPVSTTLGEGTFLLTDSTAIYVTAADLTEVGDYLAERLRPATGYLLEVIQTSGSIPNGNIILTIATDTELGTEGYQLTASPDSITLSAPTPAGLFRGIQTLRQLLPPEIEAAEVQSAVWAVPALTIRDYPRFAHRGMMLDVARHFFTVTDVKRVIDMIAFYKLNTLHLHLTDDQGWRIMIEKWPNLALHGGQSAVSGDPGGYYTQEDYAEIVAYAESRYITIIPEIDLPGHTNAALASYAELNCDGIARDLYTGIEVGFSSLCIQNDLTYQFLDDVIGELAALTPGSYIHIGGDEAQATALEDYRPFIARVQDIVEAHGKTMIGWEEVAQADLHPTSIAQHWHPELANKAQMAVEQGARVIMSPAPKAYLDMKYEETTELGLQWAGFVPLHTAYAWEPALHLPGITEENIHGVEAALWTETIRTIDDIEYMLFPRLTATAEIAWSPVSGRGWVEYQDRLAAHGPRFTIIGIDFYRTPEIDWK